MTGPDTPDPRKLLEAFLRTHDRFHRDELLEYLIARGVPGPHAELTVADWDRDIGGYAGADDIERWRRLFNLPANPKAMTDDQRERARMAFSVARSELEAALKATEPLDQRFHAAWAEHPGLDMGELAAVSPELDALCGEVQRQMRVVTELHRICDGLKSYLEDARE